MTIATPGAHTETTARRAPVGDVQRRWRGGTDATDECRPILTPEALIAAVQGHTGSGAPMAVLARELSGLYLRWIEAPHEAPELYEQIGDRINAIDGSVQGLLPRPRPGVTPGTDSVGGVVARVAEAWACAHWTLHHGEDETERHRAWDHLAEMRQGYEGLICLVLEGRIVLPKSWRGLRRPGING
ncbi:hypothetical protein [Nocardia sp. NBC_01329]|uniref:hypothetical protein n=1 Tax=Nocardia sp. NBC_01329 TaxID=2903594 RepID=UPI002E0D15AE|nr:hypothetical protein OG405_07505 [Nocardia sp. NBC_01329]